MVIDSELIGDVIGRLIISGDLECVTVSDLKYSYKKCLDPSDWETKDAFRKVIKYYLTEPEYKEFLKEVGIEDDNS